MLRRHFKQREAFRETASAHIKQLNAAVDLAVAAMDEPWGDVEKGWERHQQYLVETGIRPATGNEGVLRLNIGGLPANVHRSLIAEAEGFSSSVLGALFEQMWDRRVPRDADNRIVLDESPACVKHIFYVLLKDGCTTRARATAATSRFAAAAAAMPADEEAYLLYVSHLFGVSSVVPTCPRTKDVIVDGGTTIASIVQLPMMIQAWCPGNPVGLSLLYRASRDGFITESFQRRVRGVSGTVTLVRVKSDDEGTDSVVGGYSDIELVPLQIGTATGNQFSTSAFLFLLDSPDGGFQAAKKWNIKEGMETCAIHWPETGDIHAGPAFGHEDMCVTFGESGSESETVSCSLSARGEFYDIDEDSPFLDLDGEQVTEIEVFRVEHWPVQPETTVPEATPVPSSSQTHFHEVVGRVDEMEELYTRQFGSSLAELLMEEHMALAYAQAELGEAKIRAAAAARALAIVYGPRVAAPIGEENTVVELSVRGVAVTTLRSTLETCPGSVFSTWFSEGKPTRDDDVDDDNDLHGGRSNRREGPGMLSEDGRLKVDCDPKCFSKILDVMRMRKRDTWAAQEDDGVIKEAVGGHTIRISIPESDRTCFKSVVRMYFPGCEAFIMGLVEPWSDIPNAMTSS
ncbi:unnamed protein product, partial [Hapterophycus canaliculatus]